MSKLRSKGIDCSCEFLYHLDFYNEIGRFSSIKNLTEIYMIHIVILDDLF